MDGVVLSICFMIFQIHGSDGQFNALQQFFPSPQPPTFRPNTPFPVQPQPVTNRITAAPVTVNADCCAVNPQSQIECGYGGITESRCIARGCCYNPSQSNKYWCFQPLQEPCVGSTSIPLTTKDTVPPTAASILNCAVLEKDRVDCGFSTISREQCTNLECCFDDRATGQVPRCFFSRDKVPKFDKWSEWSKCPEKDCEKAEQKRERFCQYYDGRKAPNTLCSGNTEDKRQCACKKPCKDELGEESCKTWTGLCEKNEVVQKNCEKTCKICKEAEVVPSSSETCKDNSLLCSRFKSLCSTSKPFKNSMCKKTCGTCEEEPSGITEPAPTTKSTTTTIGTVITVTFETPKSYGNCKDKYISCQDVSEFCDKPKYYEEVKELCPVTCNLCFNQPTAAPLPPLQPPSFSPLSVATQSSFTVSPVTSGTPLVTSSVSISSSQVPGTQCLDQLTTCSSNKPFCSTSDSIRRDCPVTCNLCLSETSSTLSPPPIPNNDVVQVPVTNCKDELPTCSTFEQSCQTSENFRRACPVTCKQCQPSTPSNTFLTLPQTALVSKLPTPATIIPTTSSLTVANCKDELPTCSTYEQSCQTSENLRRACPVTCKQCQPSTPSNTLITSSQTATISKLPTPPSIILTATSVAPVVNGECQDKAIGCKKFTSFCRGSDQVSTMKDLCPLTCNFCSPKAPNSFLTLMSSDTPATLSVTARTPPAISVGERCEDSLDVCKEYAFQCEVPSSNWKTLCPQTCGECSKQTNVNNFVPPTQSSLAISALTTQSPTSECEDKVQTCNVMKPYCNAEGELGRATRENCYKTCVCGKLSSAPSASPPSTECKDKVPTCSVMKTYCNADGDVGKRARDVCYKTCGCDKQISPSTQSQAPLSPPPPSPQCFDKVKTCSAMKQYCDAEGDLGKTTKDLCYKTCVCDRQTEPSIPSLHLPWSKWTPCSKTCATGFKTRTRLCKSQGTNCKDEFESEMCAFNPCPVSVSTTLSAVTLNQITQGKSECKDKAVSNWCNQMISQINSFCSNEELALNCLATCNKCP